MPKEPCVTPEAKSEKETYVTPEVTSEEVAPGALATVGSPACGSI